MKVQEKREQKKKLIMETALKVWGRENFQNTSLSILANHLGITKQALYRYFKNKDDLIASLDLHIRETYGRAADRLTETLLPLSTEERLPRFMEEQIRFYRENPDYFAFDGYYTLRTKDFRSWLAPSQQERIEELLGIGDRELHLIVLCCLQVCRPQGSPLSSFIELLRRGAGGPSFAPPSAPLPGPPPEELRELLKRMNRDTLLTAIATVLREEGVSGATTERIAAEAGLSKSTLYNYFRNKNEMLSKAVLRITEEYTAYHKKLLGKCATFEEKLSAHLMLQNSLIPSHPPTLILLRQFLSKDVLQDIEPCSYSPELFRFIREGMEEGKLKPLLKPEEYYILFSSFVFVERLIYRHETEEEIAPPLAGWLKLLAEGIGSHDNENHRRKRI